MKKIAILLVAGFTGLMLTQGAYGSVQKYNELREKLEAAEKDIEAKFAVYDALAMGEKWKMAQDDIDDLGEAWRRVQGILPLLSTAELQKIKGKAYINLQQAGIDNWIRTIEAKKAGAGVGDYPTISAKIASIDSNVTGAKKAKAVKAAKAPLLKQLDEIKVKVSAGDTSGIIPALDGFTTLMTNVMAEAEAGAPDEIVPNIQMLKADLNKLNVALGKPNTVQALAEVNNLKQGVTNARDALKKPGRLPAGMVDGESRLGVSVDTLGVLYDRLKEMKEKIKKIVTDAGKPAGDKLVEITGLVN